MTGNVITLENVTAGYSVERPALRDVTLSIPRNDFVAVIGPNGGGKTTLLKVILGLIKPFSGRVSVDSGGVPPGYVPQVLPQRRFPATVTDVVLMGRMGSKGLFRRFSDSDRKTVQEKLDLLNVGHLAEERIDRLSGGQKQRVLIARALAGEPEMLLLDEPVASVDQDTQESFYNILSELNKRMTILLVTHDVGAVSSHVRSIACINTVLVKHGNRLEEEDVSEAYGCPFELVTHGVPHRVLKRVANSHG
ncbi:ABC transporter [Candidatus Fermentibacteria bacterium]|nr:MAG: ABC transporter [Candidatus Fermentibacteria bacterium]